MAYDETCGVWLFLNYNNPDDRTLSSIDKEYADKNVPYEDSTDKCKFTFPTIKKVFGKEGKTEHYVSCGWINGASYIYPDDERIDLDEYAQYSDNYYKENTAYIFKYNDWLDIQYCVNWKKNIRSPIIRNIVIYRCDSSGNANEYGSYAKISFDWSVDSWFYSLEPWFTFDSSSIRYGKKGIPDSFIDTGYFADGQSGSVSRVIGPLENDVGYDFEIRLSDTRSKLKGVYNPDSGSCVHTGTIPYPKYMIDFKAGGTGLAMGKPAEYENTMEVYFPEISLQSNGTNGLASLKLQSNVLDKSGAVNVDAIKANAGEIHLENEDGYKLLLDSQGRGLYIYSAGAEDFRVHGSHIVSIGYAGYTNNIGTTTLRGNDVAIAAKGSLNLNTCTKGIYRTTTVASIATAASGWKIKAASYTKWGRVAAVYLQMIRTGAEIAAGNITNITVATVVVGKRPPTNFAIANNATGGLVSGYMNSNGNVIIGALGSKIAGEATNISIDVSCVYFLAEGQAG